MEFRVATVDDGAALAALRWDMRVEDGAVAHHEPFEDYVARFEDFGRDATATGRWTVWVADDGEQLVAMIWVYRIPKVPSPGRREREFGYVTSVFTRAEFRNRQVGGRLLDAVRAWAEDEELEMLIVWPSDRSVRFYRRAGFVPAAEVLELEIAGYEG